MAEVPSSQTNNILEHTAPDQVASTATGEFTPDPQAWQIEVPGVELPRWTPFRGIRAARLERKRLAIDNLLDSEREDTRTIPERNAVLRKQASNVYMATSQLQHPTAKAQRAYRRNKNTINAITERANNRRQDISEARPKLLEEREKVAQKLKRLGVTAPERPADKTLDPKEEKSSFVHFKPEQKTGNRLGKELLGEVNSLRQTGLPDKEIHRILAYRYSPDRDQLVMLFRLKALHGKIKDKDINDTYTGNVAREAEADITNEVERLRKKGLDDIAINHVLGVKYAPINYSDSRITDYPTLLNQWLNDSVKPREKKLAEEVNRTYQLALNNNDLESINAKIRETADSLIKRAKQTQGGGLAANKAFGNGEFEKILSMAERAVLEREVGSRFGKIADRVVFEAILEQIRSDLNFHNNPPSSDT